MQDATLALIAMAHFRKPSKRLCPLINAADGFGRRPEPRSREPGEPGSDITIITIYQLLSVCRADNRESIVLIFA
jgi:hypothetical protein